MDGSSIEITIKRHDGEGDFQERRSVIVEEPLEIFVNGKPYSILMRTPGDETSLAAGFCLSEGLIDKMDDVSSIGFCKDVDSNRILVVLTDSRTMKVDDLLNRKPFRSQTSCGICGKKMIEDICDIVCHSRKSGNPGLIQTILDSLVKPGNDRDKVKVNDNVINLPNLKKLQDRLKDNQPLFQKTGGAHAALIVDGTGKMLSVAEDVGRHNAMDKAIGRLLMEKKLCEAKVAILSSRASFEMIQKAARAGIPVVACISAPTALAIELSKKVGINLIGFLRSDSWNVYC